ncbi:MAG TPA: coenzyme F420-0:L-glutamate ligase [Mycobacteriales bacterium]|nr:coenzyme F420-0:L-glutamate ligase [Mycobacteriales bacterium]
MTRLEIWPVEGLPDIASGDDLSELIVAREPGLADGDVLVVTSKVVSKAEGRLVPGSREEHVAGQTVRLVAQRGSTRIVETPQGLVLAAAGVDASNVPAGTVALLPEDPDASARRIRDGVQRLAGVAVGVLVSDTLGRPWREGVTDVAIGAAGIEVLDDLRGQRDAAGHLLEATVVAIADEIAAAADLVKRKLAATPVAVVRGFPVQVPDVDRGARPMVRAAADDLFRLGTREAQLDVVRRSRVAAGPGASPGEAAVRRAVDLIRADHPDVEWQVADAGSRLTVTGEPLAAGVAIGRLLVALAAEGISATAPVPLDAGVVQLQLFGAAELQDRDGEHDQA